MVKTQVNAISRVRSVAPLLVLALAAASSALFRARAERIMPAAIEASLDIRSSRRGGAPVLFGLDRSSPT